MRMPPTGPHDRGAEIETVYIPDESRGTLCVSSQVGCTLTCTFCHTGTQKLVRNLTTAEIVAQLLVARDRLGDWPGEAAPDGAVVPTDGGRFVSNVVLMGMGEPLYNYDNVVAALRLMSDPDGLCLSRRRITLSTSGVVPMIGPLGDEISPALAISLHATRDALRDTLVPLNKKYPIKDAARGLPHLSRPVQRAPHHLRICDAEGRQRQPRRREGAGAPAEGHSGQDQPHSVQSLARQRL